MRKQAEPSSRAGDAPGQAPSAALWEGEIVGISEPLIEVIDVLFRMHSRGFIRPLVRRPALA